MRALVVWMRWIVGSPPMGTNADTIWPASPTSMATEKPVDTGKLSRTHRWKAASSTAVTAIPTVNRAADGRRVPR